MSYEKLGFVSGQKLKAEHLNHMEEGIANAGGVTSWNDLTDKPFGEEVTEGVLTFDGNTAGKTVFDGSGIPYVKMSDKLLTVDELVGSTIDTVMKFGDEDTSGQFVVEKSWVDVFTQGEAQIIQVNLLDSPSVFVMSGNLESVGITTGEGVYFIALNEGDEIMYTRSISCLTGEVETIKPLDEKYLPDSVKGGGISIKKAVFTDRPSLWSWLQVNHTKIANVKLWTSASQCVDDMIFIGHGGVGENLPQRFSFYTIYPQNQADSLSMTISRIEVYDNTCQTYIYGDYGVLSDNVYSAGQNQEVPDEYWSAMGIEVTIYYFDE